MRLERLILVNYKNYEHLDLTFPARVTCLTGPNGAGKTNLIDAIHYLSQGRSFVNFNDALAVRDGASEFMIRGFFVRDGARREVTCSYQTVSRKKEVSEDGVRSDKLSQHLGKFPVVLMAPSDQGLITEGSEVRRRYFDSLIAQSDPVYLDHLLKYQYALKQRNALLKTWSQPGHFDDEELIDVYDRQLAEHGAAISSARSAFVSSLSGMLAQAYNAITGHAGETMSLSYKADTDPAELYDALKKGLARDRLLQRTGTGIHRDDFEFLYDGNELRKRGSQGQQKSFLIALKLANFDWLGNQKGFRPVLLLDDIFDKLDGQRIRRLIEVIGRDDFGQLFITDANPDRVKQLMKEAGVHAAIKQVTNGKIDSDEEQ